MGELIELHRFRPGDRIVPDRTPVEVTCVLPFLWGRSTVALWSSLWLAPLGLRVEPSDVGPAARR